MGIINWISKVRSAVTEQRVDAFSPSLNKEVREFNGSDLAKATLAPTIPFWFEHPLIGFPRRNFNSHEIRQYAKNPYVNMVVNAIKKQLSVIKWEVVASDEEDETDYTQIIDDVTTFLKYPNSNHDTFWDVWGPFIQDVLEMDAGTIWKGRNIGGDLTELYVYDASRFRMDVDKIGRINGYWQYALTIPDGRPKFFDKADMIYGQISRNTEYYPYGWSPLQSIQQEVEVLMQSTRYNKEFFINNAIPDGIVVAKMDKDSLKRLKSTWESSIKGKAHKLLFLNNDADFKPMKVSNKDMDWKEMQKWYFHTVFGAYGLSPMEVGFYEDGNRATGESQERITIRNAIAPYMRLIEQKINREIIPDLTGNDDVKFKFVPKDDVTEKLENEQIMAKLNANVYTINEVRKMEGKDPVEWGDKPMMMAMQEQSAELGMQSDDNSFANDTGKKKIEDKEKDKDQKKDDRDKASKLYAKLFKGFMKDGK